MRRHRHVTGPVGRFRLGYQLGYALGRILALRYVRPGRTNQFAVEIVTGTAAVFVKQRLDVCRQTRVVPSDSRERGEQQCNRKEQEVFFHFLEKSNVKNTVRALQSSSCMPISARFFYCFKFILCQDLHICPENRKFCIININPNTQNTTSMNLRDKPFLRLIVPFCLGIYCGENPLPATLPPASTIG